jgi:hypothetical protein
MVIHRATRFSVALAEPVAPDVPALIDRRRQSEPWPPRQPRRIAKAPYHLHGCRPFLPPSA